MPTQPIDSHIDATQARGAAALRQLREGGNPFSLQVAAISTSEASLNAGVWDFAGNQLEDLLEIISLYREPKTPTRVYPIVGDRGSGKTHLVYTLRHDLRRRGLETSRETMLIVLERFSEGTDAVDYLFWQMVNYLMNKRGDGDRLLGVIAGRLTARLLAESLRRLTPPQRVELIPVTGWFASLRRRLGSATRTRLALDGIEKVLEICDKNYPAAEEIRQACASVSLPAPAILTLIRNHLERSESNDVLGWLRKNLYFRLVQIALTEERDGFEDLHNGDYEDAPKAAQPAGKINHRFLEVWLELLAQLDIPVVIVFDQLEDYLRAADEESVRRNKKFFTNAICNFVNELRHVCVLVFAEQSLWSDLLNEAEPYAGERLKQPFSLKGRPSQRNIVMPDRLSAEVVSKIIQQRIRAIFPNLEITGLPATFPFQESDIAQISKEPSIRMGLQKLAQRFDDIVFRTTKVSIADKLAALWKEHFEAAKADIGSDMNLSVSYIPELQNALQRWLDALKENNVMGEISWKKTELLSSPESQPYGNLCVIRTEEIHEPGIGIGIWLGRRSVQRKDLQERIRFFKENPCPIRTLIMLRVDADKVLVGETKVAYERAIKKSDIRIEKFDAKFLYAVKAFSGWDTAANEAAKGGGMEARKAYRDFLADISKGLVLWVDQWRRPVNGSLFHE